MVVVVVVREGGSMGTWKVKVGGRRDWGFFSEKARGTGKGGVGRLQRRDFNLAPDSGDSRWKWRYLRVLLSIIYLSQSPACSDSLFARGRRVLYVYSTVSNRSGRARARRTRGTGKEAATDVRQIYGTRRTKYILREP